MVAWSPLLGSCDASVAAEPGLLFSDKNMTLEFPTKSRSFDDVKRTVRFHGYDGMFEVRFLIEATALLKKTDDLNAEAAYLNAFDRSRPEIHKAAIRVTSAIAVCLHVNGQ
jgi:hypothetical protein